MFSFRARVTLPALLLAITAAPLSAQVTYFGQSSPAVGPLANPTAAFRGRNLSDAAANGDFFWGKNDLGVGANRGQGAGGSTAWVSAAGSAPNLSRTIQFRAAWNHTGKTFDFWFPDNDLAVSNTPGFTFGGNSGASFEANNRFRVNNVGPFNVLLLDLVARNAWGGSINYLTLGAGPNLITSAPISVTGGTATAFFLASSTQSWTVNGEVRFNTDPASGQFANNESQRFDFKVYQARVVPEPSTYALLASGLAGLAVMARRRRPR